ncbi:MAG: hypothetical protein ACRYF3_04085, partial [Janthinobacterium lividum]
MSAPLPDAPAGLDPRGAPPRVESTPPDTGRNTTPGTSCTPEGTGCSTPKGGGHLLEEAAAAGLPRTLHASGSDGSAPAIDVHTPVTGEVLLSVEDTPPDAVQRIVSRVNESSRAEWSWLSGEDRARHLFAV